MSLTRVMSVVTERLTVDHKVQEKKSDVRERSPRISAGTEIDV